jgi:predicted RNA-binding Zn-ribbon protein involved in translation (DUF1610 family)
MKKDELIKIGKMMQFSCPKCGSSDVQTTDHMNPNMGGTAWEKRKCNKCGNEWERIIREYSRRF